MSDNKNSRRRPRHRHREPLTEKRSESPPSSPKVVLMRPNAPSNVTSTSINVAIRPTSPRLTIATSIENITNLSNCPSPVQIQTNASDEKRVLTATPVIKFIDGEAWTLQEQLLSDLILPDTSSSEIRTVAAVGLQSSGKSSILNRIAGKDVFKRHNDISTLLQHLTSGIDLHITSERLFLLDTQVCNTIVNVFYFKVIKMLSLY